MDIQQQRQQQQNKPTQKDIIEAIYILARELQWIKNDIAQVRGYKNQDDPVLKESLDELLEPVEFKKTQIRYKKNLAHLSKLFGNNKKSKIPIVDK